MAVSDATPQGEVTVADAGQVMQTTSSETTTTDVVTDAQPISTQVVGGPEAGPGEVVIQSQSAAAGSGHNDTASQTTITAIGGFGQNPCGSTAASLLFVTTQDFGACAGDSGLAGGGAAGGVAGSGRTDTASQTTITAIGGFGQNPCGSTAASLLFVTTQDFGACADEAEAVPVAAAAAAVPASSNAGSAGASVAGSGHNDTASQTTITAIGGFGQNPCGSTAASLLFVTTQDFGACAGDELGSGAGGVGGVGSGHTDTASQTTITAIGGFGQNPCGSTAASLLFVTTQDFGACAGDEGGAGVAPGDQMCIAIHPPPPGCGGAGSGAGHNDTASQTTITAIGGFGQNPCGSTAASLLFVTTQDFGACAG
ncbi:MAG: hypothetical protein ACRD29_02390, partial [Acidimicrobiales bacterium]